MECAFDNRYYQSIISAKPTLLERASVLNWFGGVSGFKSDHADWFGLERNDSLDIIKQDIFSFEEEI